MRKIPLITLIALFIAQIQGSLHSVSLIGNRNFNSSIIGAKIGTGGSSGAQYLITTLFIPTMPELWSVRSQL